MASVTDRFQVRKRDPQSDEWLSDVHPQLSKPFTSQEISYFAFPQLNLREGKHISDLTKEEMSHPVMRLENPFGISFKVKNRDVIWHVPPRMDKRGMNAETKGHSVKSEKCSAVFSIYFRNSFWRYGVKKGQESMGTLFDDFKMDAHKRVEWDQIDSLLTDAHPLYQIDTEEQRK